MYVCMYEQVTFTDLRPETKYTVYVVEDKLVDPKGKLVITDDIKDTCILQVAFSMHTYIPYIWHILTYCIYIHTYIHTYIGFHAKYTQHTYLLTKLVHTVLH